MAIALHSRRLWNTSAWRSRFYAHVPALLPIILTVSLLPPASVRADDIYKWTDEQGNTVISNVQPANPRRVSGMELLAGAIKPAPQATAAGSQQGGTRTEQALQARIENLERQIFARQYDQPPQGISGQDYAEGYYPPDRLTSDPGYDSGYDAGYYPAYYPNYFYPWPPSYSFVAVAGRPFARRPVAARRPGFVSRPVSATRSGVFVARPPVFLARPPTFVGRSPVFVSQSASASFRGASVGGGSMRHGRR